MIRWLAGGYIALVVASVPLNWTAMIGDEAYKPHHYEYHYHDCMQDKAFGFGIETGGYQYGLHWSCSGRALKEVE